MFERVVNRDRNLSTRVRLTHGDEFFSRSWVDRYGIVEIFLGCAHFQCYREALQHFVHAKADAVNTDNLLFWSNADQLHAARLAVRGNGGIHRGKR